MVPERDIDPAELRWPPDEDDFDDGEESAAWELVSGSRSFADLRGFDVSDIITAAELEESWLAEHPRDWNDAP